MASVLSAQLVGVETLATPLHRAGVARAPAEESLGVVKRVPVRGRLSGARAGMQERVPIVAM